METTIFAYDVGPAWCGYRLCPDGQVNLFYLSVHFEQPTEWPCVYLNMPFSCHVLMGCIVKPRLIRTLAMKKKISHLYHQNAHPCYSSRYWPFCPLIPKDCFKHISGSAFMSCFYELLRNEQKSIWMQLTKVFSYDGSREHGLKKMSEQ